MIKDTSFHTLIIAIIIRSSIDITKTCPYNIHIFSGLGSKIIGYEFRFSSVKKNIFHTQNIDCEYLLEPHHF